MLCHDSLGISSSIANSSGAGFILQIQPNAESASRCYALVIEAPLSGPSQRLESERKGEAKGRGRRPRPAEPAARGFPAIWQGIREAAAETVRMHRDQLSRGLYLA